MATATRRSKSKKSTKKKYVVTEEQRETWEQEKALVMEKLSTGIAELQSSDDWKRVLKMKSLCHSYSFQNCILISMQMPEATLVMSAGKWRKLGRWVSSGKGSSLRVMAPKRYKTMDKETGEESYRVAGFKMVSCFDISQTTGEPLPSVVHDLSGDAPGLAAALVAACGDFGIPVVYKPASEMVGCYGYWSAKENLIAIREGHCGVTEATTFFHEIAHALHGHSQPGCKKSKGVKELEAESTSFVVADHFGIDTSCFSFGYIAQYRGKLTADSLKASGSAICDVAKRIITAVEKNR